jgi:signal transduction histidine kinase
MTLYKLTAVLPRVTLLCLLPLCLLAQPKKDTLFINTQGEYPLYQHLYLYKSYKEVSPAFVYDTLKPTDFIKLYPNKAFNGLADPSKQYWLVATIKNNLPHTETFYWWLNSPAIFTARIYKQQGKGAMSYETASGYFKIGLKRQNTDNDVDFHFTLQSGEAATYFVSFKNEYTPGGYFLPQLSDAETFNAYKLHYYIVLSVIAGIMFTALLLNLFFGVFLKENIHFWYSLYIVSITFEIFEWEGISERIVDTDSLYNEKLVDMLASSSPAIFIILMARIMQWFLNQKRGNSRVCIFVDWVNYMLMAIFALYAVQLLVTYPMAIKEILLDALCLVVIVQFVLIILSIVEKLFQGYKPAWFYLLAMLLPLLGAFETAFAFFGINTIETIRGQTPNHLQLGLVVETIMVFLGIVYRSALHKKEKEKLLVELNTRQQTFIEIQEKERIRIAAYLHGNVGDTLTILVMRLNNMVHYIKTGRQPGTPDDFEKVLEDAKKASDEIRGIARGTMPENFEPADLFILLEEMVEDRNNLGSIAFGLTTVGKPKRLNKIAAIHIFYCIMEVVNNTTKHSKATEASIQLSIDKKLVNIIIKDNGIGFDTTIPPKGIGIKNIGYRLDVLNGTVNIKSSIGNGTTIVMEVPL